MLAVNLLIAFIRLQMAQGGVGGFPPFWLPRKNVGL